MRATEFTAGAAGPDAMPGSLPPSSAYTYAAELSVDEAVAAGATEVRFDKPVVNYVDNFLGFPVGGIVPTGYYDRTDGEWKAAPNGRVIKLLAIVDGKAQIDTDGNGPPDTGLGIDDAERTRLAETRHVGDELWRVPMDHFTPVGPQLALRARAGRRPAVAAAAARRRPGQPPPAGVQQEGLDHRLPGPDAGGGAGRHRHAAEAALRHPPRRPSHRPLDGHPADRPQDPREPRAGPPRGLRGRPHGEEDVRAQDRPLL